MTPTFGEMLLQRLAFGGTIPATPFNQISPGLGYLPILNDNPVMGMQVQSSMGPLSTVATLILYPSSAMPFSSTTLTWMLIVGTGISCRILLQSLQWSWQPDRNTHIATAKKGLMNKKYRMVIFLFVGCGRQNVVPFYQYASVSGTDAHLYLVSCLSPEHHGPPALNIERFLFIKLASISSANAVVNVVLYGS